MFRYDRRQYLSGDIFTVLPWNFGTKSDFGASGDPAVAGCFRSGFMSLLPSFFDNFFYLPDALGIHCGEEDPRSGVSCVLGHGDDQHRLLGLLVSNA